MAVRPRGDAMGPATKERAELAKLVAEARKIKADAALAAATEAKVTAETDKLRADHILANESLLKVRAETAALQVARRWEWAKALAPIGTLVTAIVGIGVLMFNISSYITTQKNAQ